MMSSKFMYPSLAESTRRIYILPLVISYLIRCEVSYLKMLYNKVIASKNLLNETNKKNMEN